MKRGRSLLLQAAISRPCSSSSSSAQAQILAMDPSQRYCYTPKLRWNPQLQHYFNKAYGPQAFSRISAALTQPSCYSCIRVNTLRSTSDTVIEKILEILREKGVQNTSRNLHSTNDEESVIGHKHNGGGVLCNQSDRPGSVHPSGEHSSPVFKCLIPGLDYVVFVKGSGPHDIQYDYQQDKPPKEVIVSRKCAEAVLRGAQAYVPGILACSAHVEKGDLVAVSVGVEQPGRDGGWGIGITRGTVLQGVETDTHYHERKGLYIGQGIAMMSRAGIFRALSGIAVDMTDRVFKLPSFNDVLKGDIFLQNLPSIITAHVLDPQQGERILDMCAAPGGKTTAIASLMMDKGEVIAVDRSHNKVLEIQNLAAELGLNSIVALKLDALKAVRKTPLNGITVPCSNKDGVGLNGQDMESVKSDIKNVSSSTEETVETALKGDKILSPGDTTPKSVEVGILNDEQIKGGPYRSRSEIRKQNRRMKNGPGRNQSTGGRVDVCQGFSPNSFDRILLDAPCSALGLRPRLFAGEETVESLRKHAKYQRRMFDQAVELVRPGGVIVYSTCTINPGENEGVVRYALDKYKFLSLAPQHPRIGGRGLVGGYESDDGCIEEWLREGEEEVVQRFDPSSPLDTIGFFIAKFNVGHKHI